VPSSGPARDLLTSDPMCSLRYGHGDMGLQSPEENCKGVRDRIGPRSSPEMDTIAANWPARCLNRFVGQRKSPVGVERGKEIYVFFPQKNGAVLRSHDEKVICSSVTDLLLRTAQPTRPRLG
jgi:hypothetical protein